MTPQAAQALMSLVVFIAFLVVEALQVVVALMAVRQHEPAPSHTVVGPVLAVCSLGMDWRSATSWPRLLTTVGVVALTTFLLPWVLERMAPARR